MSIKCVNIIGRWKSGCSADGSALEWGSRGRWFNSSHSDQTKQSSQCGGCFFIQVIGTSGLLQIQIRRSACRTQSVGMPLVQLQSLGPKREAKKDIEDKTSVFSRLPRPVDQQIYGPYFSDILPCAIHSGRSRTHTIFTLSGISFEAGILLLQDLGLFYSAVETDSPNRKQKNVRLLYGATIF